MPSGIVAGAGKPKDEVNYRQHEMCKTCNYFYPMNSCELVAGNISSDCICDLYELGTAKPPKHADFYMSEFQKQAKKEGM